jgi:hypothetical protein
MTRLVFASRVGQDVYTNADIPDEVIGSIDE